MLWTEEHFYVAVCRRPTRTEWTIAQWFGSSLHGLVWRNRSLPASKALTTGVNTAAMSSLTRPVHSTYSVQHQPGRPGHGRDRDSGTRLVAARFRRCNQAAESERSDPAATPAPAQKDQVSPLSKRGVYDIPRPVTQDASMGFAKAVTTSEGFTTSGTLCLRSASAATNSRSDRSHNALGLAFSHRTGAGLGIARVNSPSSGDIPQEKQGLCPSCPRLA
jgi:hypothetical protein